MKKDYSEKSKKGITSKIKNNEQSMENSKRNSSKNDLKDALDTELNAKNELKEESNILQLIIDAMPAVIGYINTDYRFQFANKFLKKLLNVNPSDIIGMHIKDVLGEKGFSKVKPKYDKAFQGIRQDFEMPIPMPGRVTPIHATYVPHKVKGKVVGTFILIQDISKRQQDEKELKDAKIALEKANIELAKSLEIGVNQFNLFADNLPGNVFLKDDKLEYIFLNKTSLKVFKLNKKSIKGLTVYDLYPKTIANKLHEVDIAVQQKKQIIEKEIKTNDINSNEKWERVIKFPIQMPDGKIFVGGIALNITQEKLKSQELYNNELKYRSLFESARDGIFILDRGKIIDCNQSILNIFGYKEKSELLNKSIFDISPEKQPNGQLSIELGKKLIKRTLAGASPKIMWVHIKKDGTQFYAEVSGNHLVYEGKEVILTSVRDITERIAIEKELQKRQDEIIEGQNLANFGNWSWDFHNNAIEFSDAVYRIYGIPLNTPLNFERVTKVIHPDDFENHKKEIEVWVQNKKVTPYEYRIVQPDGSIRYIYGVGNIEFDKKGEPVRLYGTLQDVTVQKETEHKLQIAKEKAEEGESYLDNILNNFGDPVFVKDDQSRLILVNDAFCRVFNRVKKDIIGKTLAEDVSPNEVENFLRVDKQVLKTGKESITEESLTIRGGETRIISTRKTRYVDNSGKRHIIGVIRDITDRKHAEEQVKETLMQLNMAVDTAKIGVWTHNIKTDELFWNNELFEIFGLSPSEFDRSPEAFKKMVHPEDFECVMEQHGKGLQNKSVAGFEFRIIRPNKEVRYIYASVTPIFDKEKNLIKVAGINLDITEQKTSEKALKESKTRFEILSNVTFEGILIHDKGVPIDLNSSFPKMFGYTRDEFLKHNLVELIIKKEHQNIILKNVNSEYRFPYEVIGIKKDGTEFPIEIEGRSFINEENKKLRVAAIRDISERKKAKEKLEQANLELIEAVSSLNELKKQLEDQNIYLKKELDLVFNFEEMVYGSALFSEVLTDLERVAPTDATVLVLGESGTGKELLARALHNLSLRKQKPFIKVNCSAIPTELIESELFGHKKGSFTGAVSDKVGKFELADGGTLFLDEIGDLPLSMQPKLLRFLQEGEMEVVGGTTTRSLNVRIVAATNKDLKLEVNNGQFREDLYFRLNVFPIVVPALRERKEDVPLLVEHFINKFGKKYRKKIKYISDSAMQDLKVYNWPGNIRELENLIERAIILSDNETLNIPGFGSAKTKKSRPISGAKMTLDDVQRNHILSVLEKTNWKVDGPDGAATILDIKPSTFRDKMKKLGIKRPN